jgi:1,4-alpha-glucan branching enzyme
MVEEFHIDGIRFDAARQIQNFDFLHWVVKEAKKAAGPKPFYCVAEFLPDEPCITNIDGPMDGCNIRRHVLCINELILCLGWHDSFYWTLREILLYDNTDIGRLKTVIDCRQQGFLGVTNVVNYIGNHDHDRMLVELGRFEFENFSSNISLCLGKERSIFSEEAFKRIRLGVVIQMTSIGIPMIWMGEEIGELVG